jgi:hypothetical protein
LGVPGAVGPTHLQGIPKHHQVLTLDPLRKKKEGLSNAESITDDGISKKNSILILDDRIEAAYLLGSIVSGRLHDQSDIDPDALGDRTEQDQSD